MSCAKADLDAILAGKIPSGTSGSIADAKQVTQWLRAARVHAGRLYAAVRDGHGPRKRTPEPPFWADTEAGRILAGVDTVDWVSLAGAGARDIADRLRQLETQLR